MAVSLLPTDPELGLLLAETRRCLSPTPTAEEVLRQALGASRVRTVIEVGKPLLAAAVVGGRVVTAAETAACSSPVAVRAAPSPPVNQLVEASISPGGQVLLTGSDGRLRVVSGGERRTSCRASRMRGEPFSPRMQSSPWCDQWARGCVLVDLRTGEVVQEVDHGAPTTAVAISTGNRLLATGGVDRVVAPGVSRAASRCVTLKGHVGPISAISFSARGTLLATASTDGIGRVWRTARGDPVSVLSGHANYLTDITFSPDGTQVVTASLDRTARTWKAETGAALATFVGDTDAVVSAQFAGFGLEVVTASRDGSARIWDAVVQPRLPVVAELGAPVTRVDFGNSGRSLTATAGGRAYRIALPRGPAVQIGPAPPPRTTVIGPGGATAAAEGNVVTITRPDGTTIQLVGHRADVNSVAFSADGTRVVTASARSRRPDLGRKERRSAPGSPRALRDRLGRPLQPRRTLGRDRRARDRRPVERDEAGALIYLLRGHEGKLLSVAFSPDGRRIATGGIDGSVRLYRCTICGGIDELVDLASARLGRTGRVPTDAERQRYGL